VALMQRHHTVTVQRRKRVPGSAGQKELENTGAPIPVRGNAHPLSTEEIRAYGDRAGELRKFFCRAWPGDMFSELTFDGGTWDQVEPEHTHGLGHLTKHVEVIIRRRTGFVEPPRVT
jgi:hypothetical protein